MGRASGDVVLNEVRRSARPVSFIVNTHFAPEHTTGELAFPPGAKVLGAAAEQQDIDEVGSIGSKRSGPVRPLHRRGLKGLDSFRAPAEISEREKTLDLGGVRVRMRWWAPVIRSATRCSRRGRSRAVRGRPGNEGDLSRLCRAQSSGRVWLASLDELEKLQPRIVVGAHYPIADASVINDYRVYLKALQSRVVALKKEGKSAADTAAQTRGEFAAKYKDWAQPVRIDAAATVFYREAE